MEVVGRHSMLAARHARSLAAFILVFSALQPIHQPHSTPGAGIEKSSGRRLGGKRSSSSEDIVQQMQKKMRMQDGSGSGSPFGGGGGLQAMSP